jgi:hypothetical protein
MILGAITGVPSPACLSATSNPVEALTPNLEDWHQPCVGHSKNSLQYTRFVKGSGDDERSGMAARP